MITNAEPKMEKKYSTINELMSDKSIAPAVQEGALVEFLIAKRIAEKQIETPKKP